MLFAVSYKTRGTLTEDTAGRSLKLFANWAPPAGYVFKAHYTNADGNGGLALVEIDSAAAALEVHSAWTPFFEFTTVPILEIEQAMQIHAKTSSWRASVK
ncbi:DUF3303 domain-containing protein [Pseudomonas sp. L-22-4S-12]|uniref:DUF3303 domain-containing protein n=1 Tax=unclassified Pseudomonas TaxID=196821 RepID=UPI000FA3DBDF|nr:MULTISPECIES: DUF3303 family protein [unclassified Pseudomonas]MWV18488.1 DUF3303 domain-containing protein [Pseudomonas sp. L-22-4S-12]VXC29840.1 conserved hypothetical protein [Pseudomonas sp. 8AS]